MYERYMNGFLYISLCLLIGTGSARTCIFLKRKIYVAVKPWVPRSSSIIFDLLFSDDRFSSAFCWMLLTLNSWLSPSSSPVRSVSLNSLMRLVSSRLVCSRVVVNRVSLLLWSLASLLNSNYIHVWCVQLFPFTLFLGGCLRRTQPSSRSEHEITSRGCSVVIDLKSELLEERVLFTSCVRSSVEWRRTDFTHHSLDTADLLTKLKQLIIAVVLHRV